MTSPLPPDFDVEYLVSVPGLSAAVDMTSQTPVSRSRDYNQAQSTNSRSPRVSAATMTGVSEQGTAVQGLTQSFDRDPASLEINVG